MLAVHDSQCGFLRKKYYIAYVMYYEKDIIALNRTTVLVLVMAALVFVVVIPMAAFAQVGENTTDAITSLNITTATTPTTIELGEEPLAVGRYTPLSQTMINETQQLQITFEGSTTITLPNATQPITTRDRGEGIITFLPGGGNLRAQLHLTTADGSETATADVSTYFMQESPTSITLLYFSTNSTGVLAPLNNTIAVSQDEEQPDGSVVSTLFEWKGAAGGSGNEDTTATTMATTTDETPPTAVIPTP
jgi:hypothetical protein